MSATKVMKKKQPTIADVLHYAADKCLINRPQPWPSRSNKEKFSCCAVYMAIDKLTGDNRLDSRELQRRVFDGLEAMGCDSFNETLFRRHGDPHCYAETSESVQGMRYMWLKWAALMAEEQGV